MFGEGQVWYMWYRESINEYKLLYKETCTHLNGGSVNLKLLKDGKRLFKQLTADGYVGNVRGIVVVKAIDVLHHS